jgi:hypothetical protein
MRLGERSGRSIIVPIKTDQTITRSEPYFCSRGFERTAKTAKDRAAKITSNDPINNPCDGELKFGTARINAPATAIIMASTKWRLIFSFNRNADKRAIKILPIDVRKPVTPEVTVASPKLSRRWYRGTLKRATAKSRTRSLR